MSDIVYVSFYTRGYEVEAMRLVQSLGALGLEVDIEHLRSTGDWVRNTQMKPAFIANALMRHSDARAVVWLDADSVVRERPALFDILTGDLAFHLFGAPSEIQTSTLYVAVNRKTVRLMHMWAEQCMHPAAQNDQHVLNAMVGNGVLPDLSISCEVLPESYCAFFDRPHERVVIEQFQRSRKIRDNPKLIEEGRA